MQVLQDINQEAEYLSMDMKGILAKSGSLLLFTREDAIDPNFYYLAGLSKSTRVSAYLAIGKGKPVLITNPLEYGTLKKITGFIVEKVSSEKEFKTVLDRTLGKKVGINNEYVSVNSLKRLRSLARGRKFEDISKNLREMRTVKSREEINKIRHACRITLELFAHLETLAKIGKTETEIAAEIESEAKRLGAEGMSFPSIIASGENSAVPHHVSGKTKLSEGILLADIGVIYDGYCSDMTRTYCIGEPTVMHKHMYAVVNRAKETAEKAAKAGSKASVVFDAANKIIKDSYGKDMIHGLGHGLGIDVHDYPDGFRSGSKTMLRNGMCMTIEPGFYQEGFGGMRIEDDIVIRKGKPAMLSKAPDRIVSL